MSETVSYRPTIVCVDDDIPLLRSLREQLQVGLGGRCDVEVASSGDEALQLLGELADSGVPVPLLICDHIMPGLRGVDVLSRAHRQYPDLLTILLTGQADIDAVGRALNEANLYRLITKPWHQRDLLKTVEEALRRVEQDVQLAQHVFALNETKNQLQHSLSLLQATMDAALDGLLVVRPEDACAQINRRFTELWSLPADLIESPTIDALASYLKNQVLYPDALRLDVALGPQPLQVMQRRNGRFVEFASRTRLLDGTNSGLVFSFRDVTERERQASTIRYQARHDYLTSLPNRLNFVEQLDWAVAHATAEQSQFAVFFVDLDHFKLVNDTLNHGFGDLLLQAAAKRLSASLENNDVIARWGGDEFTILVLSATNPDAVGNLARSISASLDEPFVVDGIPLRISASIGIALYPEHGDDGPTLLRRADVALHRAKNEGRKRIHFFSGHSSPGPGDDGGLLLESDLRQAISKGELEVHYQPQIDTRSGRIFAVEALARWKHPTYGQIGPEIFIPIAERTGYVLELGEWVLKTACKQATLWHAQGFSDVQISVNLSAVQFDHGDLQSTVLRVLDEVGLAPDKLELEVTEVVALRQIDLVADVLGALQGRGVHIALDDFGTGFASMTYLKRLPCNKLKIDRSFIARMENNGKDAAIVRALLALGESLGLIVVAEGVESEAVDKELRRLGCWAVQGFYYARPVPAAELAALFRRQPLFPRFVPASR